MEALRVKYEGPVWGELTITNKENISLYVTKGDWLAGDSIVLVYYEYAKKQIDQLIEAVHEIDGSCLNYYDLPSDPERVVIPLRVNRENLVSL